MQNDKMVAQKLERNHFNIVNKIVKKKE